MAFIRSVTVTEYGPVLKGDRVMLRLPQMADYPAWAELRHKSRDHLRPWEPSWSHDELTRSAYRRRLRFYQRELREDQGCAFFVFREHDQMLLGGITLSHVRRGVTQSGSLGYWIGLPFAGQGYMTDGVRAAIPFVFDTLRLHRLEAACLPTNLPSRRVLEKSGFRYEGTARGYLKIDGLWQDHVLFGLLDTDPRL